MYSVPYNEYYNLLEGEQAEAYKRRKEEAKEREKEESRENYKKYARYEWDKSPGSKPSDRTMVKGRRKNAENSETITRGVGDFKNLSSTNNPRYKKYNDKYDYQVDSKDPDNIKYYNSLKNDKKEHDYAAELVKRETLNRGRSGGLDAYEKFDNNSGVAKDAARRHYRRHVKEDCSLFESVEFI